MARNCACADAGRHTFDLNRLRRLTDYIDRAFKYVNLLNVGSRSTVMLILCETPIGNVGLIW